MKVRNYIVAAVAAAGIWSGMSAHQNPDDTAYGTRYVRSGVIMKTDSLQPVNPVTSATSRRNSVRTTPQSQRKVSHINIRANFANMKRVADATQYIFVGDVVGYHNGALITCDSAVQFQRENENIVECFGNVVINKDSVYVYGDKAIYNDFTGIARVMSPLIKMVDGNATLYTYNFTFDTYDNIGEYYGGGTISRDSTLLESERGYYFADNKDFICVGNAELRDTTYQIRSDSIGYNMNTDIATFYRKTFIWNEDGEILSAREGQYFTSEDRYRFTADAYIMTETRELWADFIDYFAATDDATLRRDIQLIDDEQSVMAFGDYGQYWGTPGNVLLTENPSLLSFDSEQPDTLYMRADSMFLLVLDSLSPFHTMQRNRSASTATHDSPYGNIGNMETVGSGNTQPALQNGGGFSMGEIRRSSSENETSEDAPVQHTESGITPELLDMMIQNVGIDSLAVITEADLDSLAERTGIGADDLLNLIEIMKQQPPVDPDTVGDLIEEQLTEQGYTEESSGIGNAALPEATIEDASIDQPVDQPVPENNRDNRKSRKEKKQRNKRNQKPEIIDTLPAQDYVLPDGVEDSENQESLSIEEVPDDAGQGAESVADETDTTTIDMPDAAETITGAEEGSDDPGGEEVNLDELEQKIVLGYHNVKVYRSDLQAVCDSLVGFSIDSTLHMYISPIIWNDNNQITSDQVVFHTQNQQLYKAVFTGERPMAGQRLDYEHFNQLTSREITMFFRDNDLYRMDGSGNAETYYYGQDSEDKALNSFITIESSNLTFMIEDGEINTITYRQNPVANLYPMNMIPENQSQTMQGFVWMEEKRPAKEDVFNRTVRPSQRTEYLELPQPYFPITDKIYEHRKALAASGRWRDRNDKLSEEDQAYVDALRVADGLK